MYDSKHSRNISLFFLQSTPMIPMIRKIISTKNPTLSKKDIFSETAEIQKIGKKLSSLIQKRFRGSLAIRQVDAGSDNTCEQELVTLGNAFYDVERFGIHFVASPKHADMLLVTGPVTRNMAEALRRAYDATPDPKIVVAVGDDAIDGGLFKESYAILGGVSSVIPVDYEIPGDPPTPTAILKHLLTLLQPAEK